MNQLQVITAKIHTSCVLVFSKFIKGKISCDRSRLRIRDAEDNIEEEIKSRNLENEEQGFKGPGK
jgi:hypothetical protein